MGERLITDEQLLVEHQRGNAAAMRALIARYQSELFTFLLRFVGDAGHAEDLFQDTFVLVHRHAATFDPSRRFRPWLFTIAANKARDFLRSLPRKNAANSPLLDAHGDGPTVLDLQPAADPGPPEILARQEEVARMKVCLAALPTLYREVVVLSYFHQFSYQEMADMLNVPLGTVKSRLHAAISQLSQGMARAAEVAGEGAE
jgi:RNA polymerase sigma-70 factor (ECF subfamily)